MTSIVILEYIIDKVLLESGENCSPILVGVINLETLGAIFSNFDIRDYKAKIDKAITKNLGESYELPIVRVKNQGSVGSCCAHALSSVVEYFNYIQHNIKTEMSVGYIYGNRTNTTHKGKGMIVRDALKMLKEYGTVTKESFPYNVEVPDAINKFNNCYNELHDEGVVSRISSYYRVKNESEIKSALKLKYPVVIAIEWYSDMKVINGVLTTKYKGKRGGHCMLLYGWNKKGWKVLNSWGCYDDNTEVLTFNGFKKFKDCTDNDLFATISEDGILEYQKANEHFEYEYNGDMYNYRNSKIDLCVTPNHNIYFRTKHKPFMLQQAKDIKQKILFFKRTAKWNGVDKKYFYLPEIEQNINKYKTCILPKIEISMEDFLLFMGYYISEGYCSVVNCTKGGKEYFVNISQHKPYARDVIRNVLNRLPFKFTETSNGFSIANKQLWEYVKDFGHAENKKIPNELLQLSPYYLQFLFDALMLGDGSSTICENGAFKNTYYTSSPILRDQFQELCLKLGYASNVYEDNRIGRFNSGGTQRYINYQIRIQRYKTNLDKDSSFSKKPEITQYDGKVYCVGVPNHTLFIRRNGKTCWCGNSKWGVNGTCIIPYDMPIREAWAVVDNIKDGVILKKPLSSSTSKQMANVINSFGNIAKQIDSKIDIKTLNKRINSKINNVAKKILSQ